MKSQKTVLIHTCRQDKTIERLHCICTPKYTYYMVSLIDAQQEDKLREEECCYQVPVDGMEVGVKPMQEAQKD